MRATKTTVRRRGRGFKGAATAAERAEDPEKMSSHQSLRARAVEMHSVDFATHPSNKARGLGRRLQKRWEHQGPEDNSKLNQSASAASMRRAVHSSDYCSGQLACTCDSSDLSAFMGSSSVCCCSLCCKVSMPCEPSRQSSSLPTSTAEEHAGGGNGSPRLR